jgi:D-arabinose 1-dehydrogenase-like Zn-dependent alcohol dehydrogenase
LPIIPGHENLDVAEELGSSSSVKDYLGDTIRVGDRVVIGANISCGDLLLLPK